MAEAHGGLGELLVVVYLAIAVASLVVANRGGLPAWLTGTAHALLGVQVILGIILYIRNPDIMPWTHALFGLLTIPALALMAPMRRRYGPARGLAVSALAVAILAAVAVGIATMR